MKTCCLVTCCLLFYFLFPFLLRRKTIKISVSTIEQERRGGNEQNNVQVR